MVTKFIGTLLFQRALIIGKRIAYAIFYFIFLVAILAKMNVLLEGIDKIVWPFDSKSSFTIKSQRHYNGGNYSQFSYFYHLEV